MRIFIYRSSGSHSSVIQPGEQPENPARNETYENLVPDRQTCSLLPDYFRHRPKEKDEAALRILWIAPLLLLAAAALAQQTPVSADTLWAGGDGKFQSAPDTALVQFSISVQQPELKAAYAKAQDSAQNIRQTLQTNGIDPRDAEIGSFSMTPRYKLESQTQAGRFPESTAMSPSRCATSASSAPSSTASRR